MQKHGKRGAWRAVIEKGSGKPSKYAITNGVENICRVKVYGDWIYEVWRDGVMVSIHTTPDEAKRNATG